MSLFAWCHAGEFKQVVNRESQDIGLTQTPAGQSWDPTAINIQEQFFGVGGPGNISDIRITGILKLNDRYRVNMANVKITIEYTIELYDEYDVLAQTITGETLSVYYLHDREYTDLDQKIYPDYHKAVVSITDIEICDLNPDGTVNTCASHSSIDNDYSYYLKDLSMEWQCTSNRNIQPSQVKSIVHTTYDGYGVGDEVDEEYICSDSHAPQNIIRLAWPYTLGAESYDLEWIFLDIPEITNITQPFEFDWRDATRINVSGNFYDVPLLYPKGAIAYRIRAVGMDGTTGFRVEGEWTRNPGGYRDDLEDLTEDRFIYCGLEPGLNWTSSLSFAEEGKRKGVVSFVDGTGRTRQTITTLNTDETTIVAEPSLDHMGRPAVNFLPVPVKEEQFKYFPKFNIGFEAPVFDAQTSYPSGSSVVGITSSNAVKDFYTLDNPFIDLPGSPTPYEQYLAGITSYLASAGDYPFTQTRMMNDGSGRPHSSSGVGSTHALGGGHDTKYYYGTPGSQKEIDRLFGSEAGFVAYYKKNMVVDANGQVSVSYLDGYGRTVATALAGTNTEDILVPLSEPPTTIKANINDNNQLLPDNTLVSTKDIVVGVNTDYTFTYSIDPAEFEHLCLGNQDCQYEFLITVKDDEGVELQTVSPLWQDVSVTTFPYEFTVPLVVGKYTVTKTLRLKQAIIGGFPKKFDELYGSTWQTTTNACFEAPFESSCFTCEEQCTRAYKYTITHNGSTYWIYRNMAAQGGLDYTTNTLLANEVTDVDGNPVYQYVASGSSVVTDAETHISDCADACNGTVTVNMDTECEMKRIILIRDVLPDGQYFENRPKDPEYSGVVNASYTTGSESDPDNRNAWLEAYAFDLKSSFGNLLNPANASASWEQIRTLWGTIDQNSTAFSNLKETLVKRHPEYCLWKAHCDKADAVCLCEDEEPYHGTPTEYESLMNNTLTDQEAFDQFLFIPTGTGYQPVIQGYDGTYYPTSNYYDEDLHPGHCHADPILYCTNSHEWMQDNLRKHMTLTIGGSPVYISVWYLLEDPEDLKSHDLGSGSHPDYPDEFVQYMQLLHGSPSNYDAMLAPYNTPPVGNQISRWQYFRSIYSFYRAQLVNQMAVIETKACMYDNESNGTPVAHPLFDDLEASENSACNTGVSCDKLPFLSAWDHNDDGYMDMGTGPNGFQFSGFEIRYPYIALFDGPPTEANLQADFCETNCSSLATQWLSQLQSGVRACAAADGGPGAYTSPDFTIPEADAQMLRAYFINICSRACEDQGAVLGGVYTHEYTTYPFSASDWSGAPYTMGAYNGGNVIESINDVVEVYMGLHSLECPVLINTVPQPGNTAPDLNAHACACDNLAYFITANHGLNAAYTGINPLKWELFGSASSVFNFAAITDSLIASSNISPAYKTILLGLTTTQRNNAILHWLDECMNNPQAEISNYVAGSQQVQFPLFMACGNNNDPIPEELDCAATELIQEDAVNGAAYHAFRSQLYADFITGYKNHCLQLAQGSETFEMEYDLQEYHYTLYYYDQAGNLVKTVPPAGVAPITNDVTLNNISIFRKAHHHEDDYTEQSGFYWPAHTKISNYRYNGQNQVIEQTTPDAGTSYFMYDALGRMALSQNAQQMHDGMASYTLYDAIGRITEVGEMQNPTGVMGRQAMQNYVQLFAPTLGGPTPLEASIESGKTGKREITVTWYDLKDWMDLGFGTTVVPFSQENLRNRVSSTFYYASYPTNDDFTLYDNATHYSYDIHGNVQRLAQDIPALQPALRRFLFTDYRYDLVSGKVNEVHYMKGYQEQFSHYYRYDADNRLTAAHTSKNGGIIRELEAKYFYYPTGPLARVELGRNQVQGLDYAYTVQGWLKGMNADVTNTYHDMGLDANYDPDNLHTLFGMDAAGFTLGYFHGDYQSIGTTRRFESETGNADEIAVRMHPGTPTDWGLYNGNIPMMNAAGLDCDQDPMPTLGRSFLYDQLNRITASSVFLKDYNGDLQVDASPTWNGINQASVWNTEHSYDADGNITKHIVEGDNGPMDQLDYIYTPGRNQLEYVKDNVPDGDYAMDIDNQLSGNYGYDLRGNLISDSTGGITDIRWNVYGKVKSVSATTTQKNIWLGYNPGGQRIVKISGITDPDDLTSGYGKAGFYVLDAQGNTMAIYEYRKAGETETRELVCTQQMIYGTSRIGMVHREEKICEDCVKIEALENSINESILAGDYEKPLLLKDLYLQAQLGTREYEISNHLGNVLATVADRKTRQENIDVIGVKNALVFQYRPEVVTSGDYYPFGMKLPGRGCPPLVCDTITTDTNVMVVEENFDTGTGGFTSVNAAVLSNSSGRLQISGAGSHSNPVRGAAKIFDALHGATHTLTFTLNMPCGFNELIMGGGSIFHPQPVTVNIRDENGNIVHTQDISTGNGTYTVNFTPSSSGSYTLEFLTLYSISCTFHIDAVSISKTVTTYSFQNCIADGSYRFGFNGQEKDNEVYGEGNSYTAEFWQYDPRLGRRWNLDPVDQISISNYAAFGNNPILFNDPKGDTFDVGTDDKSQKDVRSTVRDKNQKYLEIDSKTGRASMNFGDMAQKDVDKIINRDEGLSLINDMIRSDKKMLYEASEVGLIRDESGSKIGFPMSTIPTTLTVNASNYGKDSKNGYTTRPREGYDGQVIIHPDALFTDTKGIGTVDRRSVVFHELAENYARTHLGKDYETKPGVGAHQDAINREQLWWGGNSIYPGHAKPRPLPPISKQNSEAIQLKISNYMYNKK